MPRKKKSAAGATSAGPPAVLTTRQAADALGCSPFCIWNHARRLKLGQKIPAPGRHGHTLVYTPAELETIRQAIGRRSKAKGNPDFRDGTAARRFWRSKAGRSERKKMRGNQRAAKKD